MNTKGTRFLAVVAVMALAFTLFVALDPADENMAMNVYNFDDDYFDPEEVTTSTNWSEDGAADYRGYFYISQDTTVKMKAAPNAQDPINNLIFLVQNGATLTLDFKKTWTATSPNTLPKITIYTVTGDQQQLLSNAENTTSFTGVGKVAILSTMVQFTSAPSMSAYYEAAEMTFDAEYDRTTSGRGNFDLTIKPEVDRKAYFSADDALTDLTIGNATRQEYDVAVAPGQTIEINCSIDAVTGLEYGVATCDSQTTTYYSVGANVGDFVLSNETDHVWAIAGKVTAKSGDNTIKVNKWKENKDDGSITKIGWNAAYLIIGDGSTITANEPTQYDQMKDGEITINGNVQINGYYFSDGTVTVSNKTVIKAESTVIVGGTLVLKNDMTDGGVATPGNLTICGTGTLQLTNNDIWKTEPTEGVNVTITAFKGLVDTTGISKVARMEKEISSSKIEVNQTFELFGNTTVSKALTVEGILIVDEGVTLTVDKGAALIMDDPTATGIAGKNFAQIINYGTIVVKAEVYTEGLFVNSGKLFNYGTINMSSKSNLYADAHPVTTSTLLSDGLGIKNYGTISVSKSDFVTLAEFENTATGNFSMNGKFLGESTIKNKGRVVFNGADLKTDNTAKVTINNKGLSASVYVSSIDIGANANNKVTITDKNLSYYNDESEISKGNSTIVISTYNNTVNNIWTTSTVRGLTVAVAVDEDDYPMMAVSGGITRSSTNNDAQVEIEFLSAGVDPDTNNVPKGGNFLVEDSLSFAKNVIWSIGNAQSNTTTNEVKVVVNGTVTFNKDAGFAINNTTTGKFYANGMITCNETDFITGVQFVGARVVDADGDTYYMPLEDAVAFATLNDIDSVDVGYVDNGTDDADYTTVLSSFVIPEGMTVQTVTNTGNAEPKI
jgi:hypothetical protein